MEEIIYSPMPINHEITLNEVLNIFSDQLISSIFITNLLFLILAIGVHQYSIRYWNLPLWSRIDWADSKTVVEKSISSFAMICIPVALGFTVMILAYYYGIDI